MKTLYIYDNILVKCS